MGDGMLVPLTNESIYLRPYDGRGVLPVQRSDERRGKLLQHQADEEKYPITMPDYSEQYYIPYRAIVETNPTIAIIPCWSSIRNTLSRSSSPCHR